jgi:hypothetical protein
MLPNACSATCKFFSAVIISAWLIIVGSHVIEWFMTARYPHLVIGDILTYLHAANGMWMNTGYLGLDEVVLTISWWRVDAVLPFAALLAGMTAYALDD